MDPDAKLRPFPNLETNIVGKCQKALQNVAAIEVEPFGESLWVVDSGTSALFSRPNKDCHAKLVRIDVKNKHFEVLHVFGREVITEKVASYFIPEYFPLQNMSICNSLIIALISGCPQLILETNYESSQM